MKLNRRKFIRNLSILGSTLFLPGNPFENAISAKSLTSLNYKPDPVNWMSDKITMSWIGHSTILMNFLGTWILTDPVLSDKIGISFLGGTIGPQRLTPPALSFEEIPKPDIILLSHAHMDHLDYPTLEMFAEKYPGEIDIITAYLTSDVIADINWKSSTVIDWNNSTKNRDVLFKAVEVNHFGWRFPWEKDRSRGYFKDGRSYNAYLIRKDGRTILFGGDTAMTNKLDSLSKENIEVAIMPIGAYNPWKSRHCNPEEALQMTSRMNANTIIPVHTKTFQLGSEPFNEAIDWLNKSAPKYNIKVGLDNIGQTFQLD